MNTGWYKGINPRLERLTKMLGNSKPSHGYTISEDAPEIVTAPGVYFPAEKGEVIPLKPRREGGEVTPSLHKDNDRAKLEMVHGILSKVHPGGLEHHAMKGLAMSPESMKIEKSKYDILKSALSVLKPAKVSGGDREPKSIKTTPRQNGGEVIPTPEKDPLLKPEESVTDISSTSPLDKTNGYLRQLTTMFSRADGGDVEPSMINESEEEKLRRVLNIGPPLTPTQVELAERRKWATPGVPEGILSATREKLGPNVVSVTPGFQRSYYDAHPEERLMEQIDAANKPSIDVAQKLIEDARTRAQGFGVGFNKGRFEKGVGAQERMAAARTELPGLMQGLERLQGTASQAKAGVLETLFKPQPEEKAPAPHLVQDENGQYVWATPGGVLPAGVMGKSTPKNQQPYIDPQGKTVLIDTSSPGAQKEITDKKLKPSPLFAAEERAKIWSLVPNATTGAYFDKMDSKWKVDTTEGPKVLTGEEIRQLGLATKEQAVTERTKTMTQLAPRVLTLAEKVRNDITTQVEKLGPATGRWNQFWTGKVGAPNPAFKKLQTDVDLLSTLLANMHVGARGGEQIIQRFERMMETGKQSPENLLASIDTIIEYAKDTSKPVYPINPGAGAVSGGAAKTIVERRKTSDGRVLVKYNDGTISEEK